jgi:hypothetical protein
LFEANRRKIIPIGRIIRFAIEQVSLVPGHRDWKMLRRYTHLKPEALHEFARRA